MFTEVEASLMCIFYHLFLLETAFYATELPVHCKVLGTNLGRDVH